MVTFLVLDEGLVWAWSSLILDISMILLVLIHKVVHNLNSAVWQLYSVLTFDIVTISLFNSRVNIWVSIFIITMDIISKLVIFGFLLMVSWCWSMVGWGSMDSMVDWGNNWGMDSMGNNW